MTTWQILGAPNLRHAHSWRLHRVEHIGIASDKIRVIDGLDCIDQLVDQLERVASAELAQNLMGAVPMEGVYVAVCWGGFEAAPVLDIRSDSRVLVLECPLPDRCAPALSSNGKPRPQRDSDLLAAVQTNRPTMRAAMFPDGRSVTLVGAGPLSQQAGWSTRWRVPSRCRALWYTFVP